MFVLWVSRPLLFRLQAVEPAALDGVARGGRLRRQPPHRQNRALAVRPWARRERCKVSAFGWTWALVPLKRSLEEAFWRGDRTGGSGSGGRRACGAPALTRGKWAEGEMWLLCLLGRRPRAGIIHHVSCYDGWKEESTLAVPTHSPSDDVVRRHSQQSRRSFRPTHDCDALTCLVQPTLYRRFTSLSCPHIVPSA